MRSLWIRWVAVGCVWMGVGAGRLWAGVERVVVVFKTHFDIGYTEMASQVVQRYRTTMIDQALEVVDRNRALAADRQFVWTLSGWPMRQITAEWPGHDPARRRRVLEAYREGRFVVHALPFTTHTETLEPEELVRGLEYSSRLAREAGLELPRDAKMTDVPCHAWILPTLLKRAGVEFLHLGCNPASRSPQVPMLFDWEGPDGSRVLTMYTAESYGTGLVPPREWPYRTWLALIHTGDNHGPPTPSEVEKVFAEASVRLPGVEVRIGRLSDFSDAIRAEGAAVPVVRGDMPDTWIHGPMCDPVGASRARWARPMMEGVEILEALLEARGEVVPSQRGVLAEAREQSLLYGEHTWGGALSWLVPGAEGQRLPHGAAFREARAAGRFARSEASWEEHSAYAARASELVAGARVGLMQGLARGVSVPGPRVVVFNPLPWVRHDRVVLPVEARDRGGLRRADPWGREVAVTRSKDGSRFTARALPAMGHHVYTLTGAEAGPGAAVEAGVEAASNLGAVLENRWFRLEFDTSRGSVRSVYDKGLGREWVDEGASVGFGHLLHERFSADDVGAYVRAYVKITADWATNELGKPNLPSAVEHPYRARVPGGARLRFETSGEERTAILETGGREELPAVTARWTLVEDLPYVDLEVTVHGKEADPWPEAMWIALPFRVGQPRFKVGRPGSIVDPAVDIVRGANRQMYMVQTGVAVVGEDGAGVGVCPLDSGLVSLDEPGCWRYAPDEVPRRPRVFVNVYNNQWSTNFRLWNGGTWRQRVRLWSFARYEATESLIVPGLEARYPAFAAFADGPAGGIARQGSGLSVDRRGVLVTAMGRGVDGGGGEAPAFRLWELAGVGGPCRVRLPEGWRDRRRWVVVDLRGRVTGEEVEARGEEVVVELPRFGPVTLRAVSGEW